jgi:hypothetical protein
MFKKCTITNYMTYVCYLIDLLRWMSQPIPDTAFESSGTYFPHGGELTNAVSFYDPQLEPMEVMN